jgi:sirohydrochlorin cobaltochelatase
MKSLFPAAVAAAGLLTGPTLAQEDTDPFGVLVMAHGGGETWNGEVREMLDPIDADYPLEIAFGMADAVSLQDAVDRLEDRGVERIGVVRLFISGESWYERTREIIGLDTGAPERPEPEMHAMDGAMDEEDGGHGMSMEYWRLDTDAAFAMSSEGLAEAPEMGEVLVERARELSEDPSRESVLILAHGPGDDAENQRWIEWIDARAETVREAMPFREVRVETLREDWPEAREVAQARIRGFVAEASEGEGTAIVIPYRVQGFGPYAEVLEGLDYEAAGQGLLPSVEVEHWVRRQIAEMRAGEFESPLADAVHAAAPVEDRMHMSHH